MTTQFDAVSVHRAVVMALAASLLALATRVPAQTDMLDVTADGRDVRQINLAEGVYQFMTLRDAYVRQVNSVVVVNEQDVLVFDTNTRPSSARIILDRIRRITDKPVRYVVNSHHHPDHWSGNEVYVNAFPGVEIIATEQTRQFMQAVDAAWPARFADTLKAMQAAVDKEIAIGKQADGTDLTPAQRRRDENDLRDYRSFVDEMTSLHRIYPTLVYRDQLTLLHGGREFRFMSVTGDAEGTTVLYLPKEKILITGDAVSYPIPYVTPPPSRQARSLRALEQLDADVIVPGHGPAFRDKRFLALEAQLLEAVVSGVRAALRRGVQTLDAIQREVTVGELREQFTHNDADLDARYRERVKYIVRIAIREARDGQDLQ